MNGRYFSILILAYACHLSGGSTFSKSSGDDHIEVFPGRQLTTQEQENKKELDALYREFRKTHPQPKVDLEKIKQRRIKNKPESQKISLMPFAQVSAGLLGAYAVASIVNKAAGGPMVHARQVLINTLAQGGGSLLMRIMSSMRIETRGVSRIEPEKADISLNDLAGHMPQQLETLLQYCIYRDFYSTMFNLNLPRGVLLYGNAGTGKTLLVRALAYTLSAPLFMLTPAHILTGNPCESAKRIAGVFAEARWFAREGCLAIIFIDPVDAFCGLAESPSVLSELLKQIQAISSESILVLGATNKPSLIDQDLLQAGFEWQIGVPLPDEEKRKELLTFYAQKCPKLAGDINYDDLAGETKNFSCADLRAFVHEALYLALGGFAAEVKVEYFQQAYKKIAEQVQARSGEQPPAQNAQGMYS